MDLLLSSLMETVSLPSVIKLRSCLSSAYILPVINSWKCSLYFLPSLCLSICLSFLECNHSHAELCSASATPPVPPAAAKLSYAVESVSLSWSHISATTVLWGSFPAHRKVVQGMGRSCTQTCYRPYFQPPVFWDN